MATILYHGSHHGNALCANGWTLHEGACLTDSLDSAQRYAGRDGVVYAVELSDDVVIESCDGYDWDSNEAPADRLAYRAAYAARGVDIVRYDDADESGNTHECWRVCRVPAAVVTVVAR